MISVQGLWKEFQNRPVLHGLDLEVEAGERIALVGPNGSGKTTLLRCLLGLLSYRGRISIFGCDPIRDHVATQRMMAYVPQRAPALAIPVRDLTRFWEAERGGTSAELFDVAAQLGLDVGSVWTQKFTQLSGGMQQKLMAAMALATRCEMFLFDEPTANLDAQARSVFFNLLKSRTPAPTLVLSSHRIDELKSLVDRVIVLTEGRVVHDEPLDSLLRDPALAAVVGLEVASDTNLISFGETSMMTLLLLLACATPKDEPEALAYDHIACDHCGMIVSDPRFAAQLTTATGERYEFDDPACVFLYIQDHTPAIGHVWFHDSTHPADKDAWLDWQQVSFVESSGAPMDGGLAAVPLTAGPVSFSGASTRVLTAHAGNP